MTSLPVCVVEAGMNLGLADVNVAQVRVNSATGSGRSATDDVIDDVTALMTSLPGLVTAPHSPHIHFCTEDSATSERPQRPVSIIRSRGTMTLNALRRASSLRASSNGLRPTQLELNRRPN